MNGYCFMNCHTNCCNTAAVCSSARISRILDTACLVVSIVILLGIILITA